MADEKKHSKLTRMSLGGIEQIPGFSGDKDDYFFAKHATFRGLRNRKKIKSTRLGNSPTLHNVSQEYDPRNVDSFLGAVNEVLENEGFYLTYCTRGQTFFEREYLIGAVSIKREKRDKPKTE